MTDSEAETLQRWAWLLGLTAGESAGPSLTTAGPEGRGESEGETGAGGEPVGESEEGEEAVGPEAGVGDGGEEAGAVFETGAGAGGGGVVGGGAEEVVGGEALGEAACGGDGEDLGVAAGEADGDRERAEVASNMKKKRKSVLAIVRAKRRRINE